MIYYTPPCDEATKDAITMGRLGCITSPLDGHLYFPEDWDTVADNGCFSNRWQYRTWWEWLTAQPRSIRWATCPDVFDPTGSPCHTETLERWHRFAPQIKRAGFTPAFVVQVGATPATVPADADVLFVGGTVEFKFSDTVAQIVAAAQTSGQWVHVGRVNTLKRLTYCAQLGVDSCDGTYITYGPAKNLPRILRFLDQAHAAASQTTLNFTTT